MEPPIARAWFKAFKLKPREFKTGWKLIGLAFLGVILLLLQSTFSAVDKPAGSETKRPTAANANWSGGNVDELITYESELSSSLASTLRKIEGAGDVFVSVSVSSSPSRVYAKEELTRTRNTQEGGIDGDHRTSAESEMSSKLASPGGTGAKEVPVVRVVKPEVIGVVVIAEGASDPDVKARLMQAVQVALALPPHKITVLPADGSERQGGHQINPSPRRGDQR